MIARDPGEKSARSQVTNPVSAELSEVPSSAELKRLIEDACATDQRFQALWARAKAVSREKRRRTQDWDLELAMHALRVNWKEEEVRQLLREYRAHHKVLLEPRGYYFIRTVRKAASLLKKDIEADLFGAIEQEPTDTITGEEFAYRFNRQLRHVSTWKKWIVWDGKRWRHEGAPDALLLSKQVARDADISFEKVDRRRAMLATAAAELSIRLEHEQLDAKPMLLNCPNGTLELETMKLRPHHAGDFITQITQVPWVPRAESPLFARFMNRVLPDPEVRAFVQRALGYSLSGLVDEDALFIAWGDGANGKTTLMQLVQRIVGDYSASAPPGLLLVQRNESHPTQRAALFRKRLVVCSESGQDRELNEELVKELTGRDRIAARRMREDFWEFDPTHKLWLQTNHRPAVRGRDEGIWRRLHLVPFDVTIPKAERDPKLPSHLLNEEIGILAWLVRGWQDYLEIGLAPPGRVQDEILRYRSRSDAIGAFLAASVDDAPDGRVQAGALHKAYCDWAKAHDLVPVGLNPFGQALTTRGFQKKASDGRSWWLGKRLRQTEGGQDVVEG